MSQNLDETILTMNTSKFSKHMQDNTSKQKPLNRAQTLQCFSTGEPLTWATLSPCGLEAIGRGFLLKFPYPSGSCTFRSSFKGYHEGSTRNGLGFRVVAGSMYPYSTYLGSKVLTLTRDYIAHRPLSSSFLWFIFIIL